MISKTEGIVIQLLLIVLLLSSFAFTVVEHFTKECTAQKILTQERRNTTISNRENIPTANNTSGNIEKKYSILPKRIYTVIGLESSGTQFVTGIIRDALKLPMYREGSYNFDFSGRPGLRMEQEDVQVQHFSLPFGGGCRPGLPVPIVDVVLPSQCTRYQNKKARSVDECKAMQEEIWGIKSSGTRFRYPLRYQLDIVSHKEWYDSHGVEQFFIIVVRDQDASRVARSDHCRNEKLKLEEERVGTDIIVDAINRYILKDGEKKVTRDNYQFWAAESYNTVEKNLKGRRLQATGLPSGNNVVLVSYELLVKLGQAYVKTLYAALGIESNHVPNIKNGNSKYIDGTGKKIPRKRPRTKNVNNSQENSMALDASKEVNSRQENVNSRVTRRQEPQPVKNLRRKRIHSHRLNQYSVRRQDYN